MGVGHNLVAEQQQQLEAWSLGQERGSIPSGRWIVQQSQRVQFAHLASTEELLFKETAGGAELPLGNLLTALANPWHLSSSLAS